MEVVIDKRVCYRVRLMHPSVGEVRLPMPASPPLPVTLAEEKPGTVDYLWITETPGGSGGYTTTYLFEPPSDGDLLPVARLENGSFTADRWVQPDVTYRYWLTSGAGSPTPLLSGIPTAEGLHWLDPAPGEGPTADELAHLRSVIASATVGDASADHFVAPALRGFLELVYAGRAVEAWRFLDGCFDAGLSRYLESAEAADMPRSRDAFRGVLVEKMRTSPFFGEVLRRNGGSIAPPER